MRFGGNAQVTGDTQGANTAEKTLLDQSSRGRAESHGLLITVSGMDGSGKSSAAGTIKEHLEGRGRSVELSWGRLDAERELLGRIAGPVKRLLSQRDTIADPVAVLGASAEGKATPPPKGSAFRRLVKWAWVLVIAVVQARNLRRTARRRRAGRIVLCDRWLTDALIDIQLRYRGRYRLAQAILRLAVPTPDLALLLEVDAATAAQRKPGDRAQQDWVEMEGLYGEIGRRVGAVPVVASASADEVRREVVSLVDAVLAGRTAASGQRDGAPPPAAAAG
jgi:thymidylate kinase